MTWPFFTKNSKSFLGIDIGTSSIKIVELSKSKDKINLENYGEMIIDSTGENFAKFSQRGTPFLNNEETSQAINQILSKAQIVTRDAFFSISDFSTFFTFLKLPPMNKQEISSAIQYEARQHIPLPLSDVVLDWIIIKENNSIGKEIINKVLLVAIPHEVINQYQAIAKKCQVKPISLEAEVFGLVRSLIKKEKGKEREVVGLLDIGAQSTTFNIVENGSLRMTHSFDFSGSELTKTLSKSLNISYNEAENLKKKYGVSVPEVPVGRVLSPFIDLLSGEIDRFIKSYRKSEKKEINKMILAGGIALLPGLQESLSSCFKKPVEIGNPFMDMNYNPILEGVLREMGPSCAVAVGSALRGFEKK